MATLHRQVLNQMSEQICSGKFAPGDIWRAAHRLDKQHAVVVARGDGGGLDGHGRGARIRGRLVFTGRLDDQPVFVDRADAAYAVYAPEQRHAVEVAAADEDHLATWLSTRLGRPLAVPLLRRYGYSLIGGRLPPGEFGPAALFMYENAIGVRLTLYIASVQQNPMALRLFRKANRNSIYWTSQGMGYALTGQVSYAQLQSMKIDVDSALGVVVR